MNPAVSTFVDDGRLGGAFDAETLRRRSLRMSSGGGALRKALELVIAVTTTSCLYPTGDPSPRARAERQQDSAADDTDETARAVYAIPYGYQGQPPCPATSAYVVGFNTVPDGAYLSMGPGGYPPPIPAGYAPPPPAPFYGYPPPVPGFGYGPSPVAPLGGPGGLGLGAPLAPGAGFGAPPAGGYPYGGPGYGYGAPFGPGYGAPPVAGPVGAGGYGAPPAAVGPGVPPAAVGPGVPPAAVGPGVPPAAVGPGIPPAAVGPGIPPPRGGVRGVGHAGYPPYGCPAY